MLKFICVLILCSSSLFTSTEFDTSLKFTLVESDSKYDIGDKVRCSQWKNSYWEGVVVRAVKDAIYQVQLEKIYVDGGLKMYLNASECTGKKTLSFENGKEFHETKIWVHERCLD